MFGWVKKKVLQAGTDAAKNEIVRFIAGLKGASDQELGMMIAIATIIRVNFTKMGRIPPEALDFGIRRDNNTDYKCEVCAVYLVNAIKQFQSIGQQSDAAGTMIWLHSVRSLNDPEIRLLGREMWKELDRGFPYAFEALEYVREMTGKPLPDIEDELRFTPRGL